VPAEGATHRDSHELRDLAPVSEGEDAWVLPHGVLADTPGGRTRHPRGCPRRIPSRGGANAEFVVIAGGHQALFAGGVCDAGASLGGGGQQDSVVGGSGWTVRGRVSVGLRVEGV